MGQRATRAMLSLAGRWRFSLDRADVGVGEKWFSRELDDELDLPGSLQAQGFGDDIAVDTPWTGDIYDRSWFVSPQYARYTRAGTNQGPFLAPAGQALRRRRMVPAGNRHPRRVERKACRLGP